MESYPLGRTFSQSKKYVVDITRVYQDMNGQNLYIATVMEVIRNYFQPILSGVGLIDNEIKGYMER